MHVQHRHGAPSRPRTDHHTVWDAPKADSIGPIRGTLMLGALFAIATLLLVMLGG